MPVTESPRLSDALELVRRVRMWPFVRVDLEADGAALHSGVRDTFIARLDLLTGGLTAFVAADMARSVVATEPLVRLTRHGVRIDVVDVDSRQAGERLIRWRIDLERFGVQFREASP
ncbi:MAG TPA: hypothetical protein VK501_13445 [Baekduia sp.]|uniref:hypothetical protein n=1 Tax=Baekduia sp. TaxID=2600305 RepID=UPI002C5E65B7|nr:hypothetical protein [Baekduia sp.]HMJ34911.1 hypothetical protein [Baekduia sp.]